MFHGMLGEIGKVEKESGRDRVKHSSWNFSAKSGCVVCYKFKTERANAADSYFGISAEVL